MKQAHNKELIFCASDKNRVCLFRVSEALLSLRERGSKCERSLFVQIVNKNKTKTTFFYKTLFENKNGSNLL